MLALGLGGKAQCGMLVPGLHARSNPTHWFWGCVMSLGLCAGSGATCWVQGYVLGPNQSTGPAAGQCHTGPILHMVGERAPHRSINVSAGVEGEGGSSGSINSSQSHVINSANCLLPTDFQTCGESFSLYVMCTPIFLSWFWGEKF